MEKEILKKPLMEEILNGKLQFFCSDVKKISAVSVTVFEISVSTGIFERLYYFKAFPQIWQMN